VDHERGAIAQFLAGCDAGSPVAVEAVRSWYWIVDEIESAGMGAQLVHARRAKMMLAASKRPIAWIVEGQIGRSAVVRSQWCG
jgi:hypothetical protein